MKNFIIILLVNIINIVCFFSMEAHGLACKDIFYIKEKSIESGGASKEDDYHSLPPSVFSEPIPANIFQKYLPPFLKDIFNLLPIIDIIDVMKFYPSQPLKYRGVQEKFVFENEPVQYYNRWFYIRKITRIVDIIISSPLSWINYSKKFKRADDSNLSRSSYEDKDELKEKDLYEENFFDNPRYQVKYDSKESSFLDLNLLIKKSSKDFYDFFQTSMYLALENYPENVEFVVLGLGNKENFNFHSIYDGTSHNIGHQVLDFLTKALNVEWVSNKKHYIQEAIYTHKGRRIRFVKNVSSINKVNLPFKSYLKKLSEEYNNIRVIAIADDIQKNIGSFEIISDYTNKDNISHNGIKALEKDINCPILLLGTNYSNTFSANFSSFKDKSLAEKVLLKFPAHVTETLSSSLVIAGLSLFWIIADNQDKYPLSLHISINNLMKGNIGFINQRCFKARNLDNEIIDPEHSLITHIAGIHEYEIRQPLRETFYRALIFLIISGVDISKGLIIEIPVQDQFSHSEDKRIANQIRVEWDAAINRIKNIQYDEDIPSDLPIYFINNEDAKWQQSGLGIPGIGRDGQPYLMSGIKTTISVIKTFNFQIPMGIQLADIVIATHFLEGNSKEKISEMRKVEDDVLFPIQYRKIEITWEKLQMLRENKNKISNIDDYRQLRNLVDQLIPDMLRRKLWEPIVDNYINILLDSIRTAVFLKLEGAKLNRKIKVTSNSLYYNKLINVVSFLKKLGIWENLSIDILRQMWNAVLENYISFDKKAFLIKKDSENSQLNELFEELIFVKNNLNNHIRLIFEQQQQNENSNPTIFQMVEIKKRASDKLREEMYELWEKAYILNIQKFFETIIRKLTDIERILENIKNNQREHLKIINEVITIIESLKKREIEKISDISFFTKEISAICMLILEKIEILSKINVVGDQFRAKTNLFSFIWSQLEDIIKLINDKMIISLEEYNTLYLFPYVSEINKFNSDEFYNSFKNEIPFYHKQMIFFLLQDLKVNLTRELLNFKNAVKFLSRYSLDEEYVFLQNLWYLEAKKSESFINKTKEKFRERLNVQGIFLPPYLIDAFFIYFFDYIYVYEKFNPSFVIESELKRIDFKFDEKIFNDKDIYKISSFTLNLQNILSFYYRKLDFLPENFSVKIKSSFIDSLDIKFLSHISGLEEEYLMYVLKISGKFLNEDNIVVNDEHYDALLELIPLDILNSMDQKGRPLFHLGLNRKKTSEKISSDKNSELKKKSLSSSANLSADLKPFTNIDIEFLSKTENNKRLRLLFFDRSFISGKDDIIGLTGDINRGPAILAMMRLLPSIIINHLYYFQQGNNLTTGILSGLLKEDQLMTLNVIELNNLNFLYKFTELPNTKILVGGIINVTNFKRMVKSHINNDFILVVEGILTDDLNELKRIILNEPNVYTIGLEEIIEIQSRKTLEEYKNSQYKLEYAIGLFSIDNVFGKGLSTVTFPGRNYPFNKFILNAFPHKDGLDLDIVMVGPGSLEAFEFLSGNQRRVSIVENNPVIHTNIKKLQEGNPITLENIMKWAYNPVFGPLDMSKALLAYQNMPLPGITVDKKSGNINVASDITERIKLLPRQNFLDYLKIIEPGSIDFLIAHNVLNNVRHSISERKNKSFMQDLDRALSADGIVVFADNIPYGQSNIMAESFLTGEGIYRNLYKSIENTDLDILLYFPQYVLLNIKNIIDNAYVVIGKKERQAFPNAEKIFHQVQKYLNNTLGKNSSKKFEIRKSFCDQKQFEREKMINFILFKVKVDYDLYIVLSIPGEWKNVVMEILSKENSLRYNFGIAEILSQQN